MSLQTIDLQQYIERIAKIYEANTTLFPLDTTGESLVTAVVRNKPAIEQSAEGACVSTKNYVDTHAINAIWTKSGTDIFQTTLTDRVGIGVNTPQEQLHILTGGTSTYTAPFGVRGLLLTDDSGPRLIFQHRLLVS